MAGVDDVAEEVAFGTDDVYGLSAEEEAIRMSTRTTPPDLGLGRGSPGYLDGD